jgi:hypothetical protein
MTIDDTTAPAVVVTDDRRALRRLAQAPSGRRQPERAPRGQSIALAAAVWATALLGGVAAALVFGDASTSSPEQTERFDVAGPSTRAAGVRGALNPPTTAVRMASPSLTQPRPAVTPTTSLETSAPDARDGRGGGSDASNGQTRGADNKKERGNEQDRNPKK